MEKLEALVKIAELILVVLQVCEKSLSLILY